MEDLGYESETGCNLCNVYEMKIAKRFIYERKVHFCKEQLVVGCNKCSLKGILKAVFHVI